MQLMMESDTVIGFQVMARDITERKSVEQALAESERRFREVIEKVDLLAASDRMPKGSLSSVTTSSLG